MVIYDKQNFEAFQTYQAVFSYQNYTDIRYSSKYYSIEAKYQNQMLTGFVDFSTLYSSCAIDNQWVEDPANNRIVTV